MSSLADQFDLQLDRYAPDIARPAIDVAIFSDSPYSFPRAWVNIKLGVWFIDPRFCPETSQTHYLDYINRAQLEDWLVILFNHENVFSKPIQMIDQLRSIFSNFPQYTLNVAPLSKPESTLLYLVAGGHKNLGEELGLSRHTIYTQVSNITTKLGAASRANAVAIALALGLIHIDKIPWTLDPFTLIVQDQQASRRREAWSRSYHKKNK